MDKIIPFFTMVVDPDVEGMDFMGLVDSPAHMKGYQTFSAQKKVVVIKDHFNEEKRIVTGVAIAVDLPIYRNDDEIGEHYVIFKKEDTENLWITMMQKQYMHNVNNMHNMDEEVDGLVLFHSYPVDKAGGLYPEMFKDQNLKDGSIVVSYKATTDEAWEKVKANEGFSIEGWFKKVPLKIKGQFKKDKNKENKVEPNGRIVMAVISEVSKWDIEVLEEAIELGTELHYTWKEDGVAVDGGRISDGEYQLPDGRKIQVDSEGVVVMLDGEALKAKKKNKNSKKNIMKKGLFARIFGAAFASMTTVGGIEIFWDGDLEEGTEVNIEDENGDKVIAPEGDHSWIEADGTMTVITVDGNGKVTAITNVEAPEEEAPEENEEMDEELAKVLAKLKADNESAVKVVADAHEAYVKATDDKMQKLEDFNKTLCEQLDKTLDLDDKKKFARDGETERFWKVSQEA